MRREPKSAVVEGRHQLQGEVRVSGAKNAVLKLILAAALLTSGESCIIHNVPMIGDVLGDDRGPGQAWAPVLVEGPEGVLEIEACDTGGQPEAARRWGRTSPGRCAPRCFVMGPLLGPGR